MKFNRKVKNFLINPRFQLTVIGYFAAISFLACATLYTTVYLTFNEFAQRGTELGLEQSHIYYQFIQWQKNRFDLVFLGVSLSLAAFMIVGGIILSHKIAGPLHRFKSYLNDQKGDPEIHPLAFRDGDFFPEIPDLFNDYQETKFGSGKKQSHSDDEKKAA